ncbi:MAG: quinolinate synthase NadA [Halobacteriovoraceae bacterium]|nr:quinolinate synthase NadA [Halobacteriovoraceae bacterium]
MIDLFGNNIENTEPITQTELSDEEVLFEIDQLKAELKEKLIILGHHYQQDDIIRFADIKGDSLALAQKAKETKAEYIMFCGVHFMAETADIVTHGKRTVVLPDLRAGCSMADMASAEDINKAWSFFKSATDEKIVPITYINCAASLKSFVGKNEGSICTSSNAKKVIKWALEKGDKLLFFPDQHLGRNTCFELGIPLEEMVVYDPNYQNGGLSSKQIQNAKVILWYGLCSVHQGFTKEQVLTIKKNNPRMEVIVHPECNFEVFSAADDAGSTAYIIDKIKRAPAGSEFAVGTEINLVNRLAHEMTDKKIISLSPYQCLCTTMYRIRPRWLLASMRAIKNNNPINVIKVDKTTREFSLRALEAMFKIT